MFERLLYPISNEFKPELIFISCGFDSARGDYVGGVSLDPEAYAYMIQRF